MAFAEKYFFYLDRIILVSLIGILDLIIDEPKCFISPIYLQYGLMSVFIDIESQGPSTLVRASLPASRVPILWSVVSKSSGAFAGDG